jgi:hypothetical protein
MFLCFEDRVVGLAVDTERHVETGWQLSISERIVVHFASVKKKIGLVPSSVARLTDFLAAAPVARS